jgi:hypothetical protein
MTTKKPADCPVIKTSKLTFKLVRSFSVGVSVHSPALNGLSFEVYLGCVHVAVWSRGTGLVGFANYWAASTPKPTTNPASAGGGGGA